MRRSLCIGRSVGGAHRDAEDHEICTVSEPSDAFDLVILPVGLQFCGQKSEEQKSTATTTILLYTTIIYKYRNIKHARCGIEDFVETQPLQAAWDASA